MTQTKQCGICAEHKPLSEYARDGGANYLRYECRKCASEQSQLLRRIKKTAPRPSPDHRCAICLRNWQEMQGHSIRTKHWVCDHDHETGLFRGWLCAKCNLGLGNLADDVQRLQRAIDYLQSNSSK